MAAATTEQARNHGKDVQSLVVMAFLAIALYNTVEFCICTYSYFKRRGGLYFWSLVTAAWSICLYTLGNLLNYYGIIGAGVAGPAISVTIRSVGWVGMITSQSLILYSRLHLIVHGTWIRYIIPLIITDAVIFQTPVVVTFYMTHLTSNGTAQKVFDIFERIEVIVFFCQETMLSTIYIWRTVILLRSEGPILKTEKSVRGKGAKDVLVRTMLMSLLIVCMDIGILALEFGNLLDVQTAYKCAVYSVKAKLEFIILNQLLNLVQGRLRTHPTVSPVKPSTTHTEHIGTTTDNTNKTLPSVDAGVLGRLSTRSRKKTDFGNSAGAYSKMEEGDGIALKDFDAGANVVKTTEVDVTVERERSEGRSGVGSGVTSGSEADVESQKSDGKGSVSRTSSETRICGIFPGQL